MNNRILTALFALALCLCLFIGVVPAEADAVTAKCGHTVIDTVGSKSATCTEAGIRYTYYKCRVCDKTYADAACQEEVDVKRYELSAKGHNWEIKSDATTHWERCSNCGTERNIQDHAADGWVQTSVGHKQVCTVCNATLKDTEGLHVSVYKDNGDGENHHAECQYCGYITGADVAHTFTYAKKDKDGHTATCSGCGYTVVQEHVDIDVTKCKCDKCEELLHDFSIYVPGTENRHAKGCSVCKTLDPDAVYEPCEYVYTSGKVLNNKATHTLQCEVCGRGKEEPIEMYCTDADNDCICDLCKGPMFHDWNAAGPQFFPAEEPTCEDDGNVAYAKCNKCQKYFLPNGQIVTEEETVLEALGHDWRDTMWSNPTHHYYRCQRVVNDVTCTAVKDREEHVFDKFVSGNNGYHFVYCSVCDREGDPKVAACVDIPNDGKCECACGYQLPHGYGANYPNVELVEAVVNTCTKDGNIAHFHCKECGGNFGGTPDNLTPIDDVVVKASGHNLVIKETRGDIHDVQCVQKNKVQKISGDFDEYACTYKSYVGHQDTTGDCKCDLADEDGKVCGAALHTHSYKFMPAVEATCSTEGFEAYYYFAPCGRMFSDDTYTQEISAPVSTGYADCEPGAWVNEGDNHVKRCVNCNEVVDSAAHVDANFDNRCDVCNFELALEYVEEVPATCTTSGTKAHYISRVTGRSYWDAEGTKYISNVSDLVIRAYAHIDPVTGVGPIASDKGNGTHEYKCALCNATTKTEAHTTGGCFCTACGAGASASHVAKTYPYQAPVCDKDGHEAYAQCSCGKFYNAQGVETTYQALTLKATGHKWGAEVFNDDAAGKHYAVCEICNAKNYGEHKVTASDPLSGNYHQFVCECGEVSLEAHYDKNGDNVCDEAGCKHDMSNKEVTVNNNPSTTVVTGDKNTVNTAWSWLRNWLNNTVGSNAGGSTTPTQTAQPGTATGSQGSTSGNSGTTTTPATGSNTGSTGAGSNAGSSNQGGNQTANATGVLQAIISFFNWIISGFGG